MCPIVKFLMCICYPICCPIGICLDYVLGIHGNKRFVKRDLKALIELHEIKNIKDGQDGDGGHHEETGQLTKEEIKIITSTIDLRDIQVKNIVVQIKDVFT